jgi:hypothetical protein
VLLLERNLLHPGLPKQADQPISAGSPSDPRYRLATPALLPVGLLRAQYDSPALGVIVALVDIVALIPYLVLQFKGLGIIIEIAGYRDLLDARDLTRRGRADSSNAFGNQQTLWYHGTTVRCHPVPHHGPVASSSCVATSRVAPC